MKKYDPSRSPDPDAWLEMDEEDRIALVERFHRKARIRMPNLKIHAIVHNIVETQIAALDPELTSKTLNRLMSEGLNRHDAIHAIGGLVAEQMYHLMKREVEPGQSKAIYAENLVKLTAANWLASNE